MALLWIASKDEPDDGMTRCTDSFTLFPLPGIRIPAPSCGRCRAGFWYPPARAGGGCADAVEIQCPELGPAGAQHQGISTLGNAIGGVAIADIAGKLQLRVRHGNWIVSLNMCP